ncbi:cellulose binding domain-containing protein [Archangium violaceum]|uniref:cellulose binding domain-containing protein n=1 Tax=Archangium violaceum TaxID=83451 RepID=UPI001EF0CDCA|nr:cellulose binding domain-containing protein [Archangium violaceum]
MSLSWKRLGVVERSEQTWQGKLGLRRACATLLSAAFVVFPLGESFAGTNDFTVQYQNINSDGPNDDIVEAEIKFRNNTSASIPLSSIVVRYWFTKNNAPSATVACWYWNGSAACPNLTVTSGTVSYTGADRYAEIRFTSGAGSLAPGAWISPIDLGVMFGANTNETDDYSYGSHSTFIDWSRITVHDAGSSPTGGLRGGTPPSVGGSDGGVGDGGVGDGGVGDGGVGDGGVGDGGVGDGGVGDGGVGDGGTITTEFFDDFSYTGTSDSNFRSWWSVRNDSNWSGPGPQPNYGAPWSSANVSFIADPSASGNKLMRLQASTRGTNGSTLQAEVSSNARKFKFGTYAARVKFNNTPLSGTRYLADKPVETFFTITEYVQNDPNYSEQDFEYMPNGGWGEGDRSTIWMTSWEDTRANIQESDKVSNHLNGDYASQWQTLVLQVSPSSIRYYVNGVLLTMHSDLKYLPETDQFIYFNIWFDELDRSKTTARTYHQDVDWVYFAEDAILSSSEVTARVSGFRTSSTTRRDTVK